MKEQCRSLIALLVILATLFALVACNTVSAEGKWENATYRRDKSFGDGETTITVDVIAGENSVTFTISTDKETLADALLEHKLIEGDNSEFGIYIKKVNGITADYDVDQSWWGVMEDGKDSPVGASSVEIADGKHYALVYKK